MTSMEIHVKPGTEKYYRKKLEEKNFKHVGTIDSQENTLKTSKKIAGVGNT